MDQRGKGSGRPGLALVAGLMAAGLGLMWVLATTPPAWAQSSVPPTNTSASLNRIAFSRFISSTNGHEARFVNLDGTQDISITAGWRPRLSPDGDFILFNRDGTYSNGPGDNEYIEELATQTITRVVNNPTDYLVAADWLTDGQKVIFDGACAIYQINRDGSNLVNLTSNHNCYDDAPTVNRLSGLIAFHNQFSGLYTMQPNGTSIQHIPNTQANDWWPRWSADGQWLSFLRGANYYKIQLDGSRLAQLTFSNAVITGLNDYNPNLPWSGAPWSADGGSVVGPRTVNGVQGIYAIASDGSGAMTRILASPAGTWVDDVGTVVGSAKVIRWVNLPLMMR